MKKVGVAILGIILTSLVAIAASLDLQIKSILRETVAKVSGYKGGAVVNVYSGELMGYYIPNERIAVHKQHFAAAITNIVRSVEKAGNQLGLHPVWFGIKLNNGDKLFVSIVNDEVFLGALYSDYSPNGLIKYQLKKATKRVKYILD